MGKGRLEAFSDGVMAVIITIMVLEMKVPHGSDLAALVPLLPVFVSYVLSFVMVGIYWNNHHHLLHSVSHINGRIMLANMHLLLWLSLFPFVTGWMGENHFGNLPSALFGVVALMCGVSYKILVWSLIVHHGRHSTLAAALGKDIKGWSSLAIYAVAIPLAFYDGVLAFGLYILVAAIWFAPDRRIEKHVGKR